MDVFLTRFQHVNNPRYFHERPSVGPVFSTFENAVRYLSDDLGMRPVGGSDQMRWTSRAMTYPESCQEYDEVTIERRALDDVTMRDHVSSWASGS